MGTRNRIELLNTMELSLVGPRVREGFTIDDLDGAIRAHDVSPKPDLTKAAAADATEQIVIRYPRRRSTTEGLRQTNPRLLVWLVVIHFERWVSKKFSQHGLSTSFPFLELSKRTSPFAATPV
jgi:hypothetical protein